MRDAPDLACGRFQLSLARPLVMGIVNATPDSFAGQGKFSHQAAIDLALDLLAQGADIIDVGGESTRPGAKAVDAEEEWRRIAPILAALRDCGVPLSVDTFKPATMRRALDAGVDMINDIYALRQPGALAAVASSDCAVCLMHMQGEPGTMQQNPQYGDVVAEVAHFLHARADVVRAAGVAQNRIVLDPGFGFGKTAQHNYTLLNRLDALYPNPAPTRGGGGMVSPRPLAGEGATQGRARAPILIGVSRKSMIGAVVDRPPAERLAGSLAAALAAVARGARIVRTHDVAATRDALAVWHAVEYPGQL